MTLFLSITTAYLIFAIFTKLASRRKTPNAAIYAVAAKFQLQTAGIAYLFALGYALFPTNGWYFAGMFVLIRLMFYAYSLFSAASREVAE